MNRKKWAFWVTILFFPVFLYNACSQVFFPNIKRSDTVVGNPFSVFSTKLASTTCRIISSCHPEVSFTDCQAGVMAAPGANVPLNLSSSYGTLNDVLSAENSGQLAPSLVSMDQCSQNISLLSCSDPLVQQAYVQSASVPFAGAVNMIAGAACGQALSPISKYSCSTKVFLRNTSNSPLAPSSPVSGWSFSVFPALPQGLNLDAATGVISGTPTTMTAMTAYTVTAVSASGTNSTVVNLETADGYLVNDLSDSHNVGSGCSDANKKCTLRAAIESINNQASPGVVVLPAGLVNLNLNTELAINQPAEIFGDCSAGTTVDGLSATRVFHVTAGPTVFHHITVQNGRVNDSGAGIYIQSVTSAVAVTLDNVTVQNNISTGTGGGGGISLDAGSGFGVNLAMDHCLVQNNTSTSDVAGGLGAFPPSQVTITNSIFQDNAATDGGAMVVDGSANISQSLFFNNTATTGKGGAIYCANSLSGTRHVSLTNVTVYGNTAARGGGLVFANSGVIDVVNSTIVNNHSLEAGGYGGGLTGNGGGGSASLKNSIIAGNDNNGTILNCGAGVSSSGYNLSDTNDCGLSGTGDLPSLNPQLGPLVNNGGFSATMAVLPGSPALKAVGSGCPSIDQRGAQRSSIPCDMGAFEVQ